MNQAIDGAAPGVDGNKTGEAGNKTGTIPRVWEDPHIPQEDVTSSSRSTPQGVAHPKEKRKGKARAKEKPKASRPPVPSVRAKVG